MTDLPRRVLNVVFALTLFPAASFSAWSGIGQSIGNMANADGFSPETPAGYAFAIWGVIFTLTLIYAFRQALPGQVQAPLYRSIGWATIGSSIGNSLWMLLAQTVGDGWWLLVTIIVILAFALIAFFGTLARHASLDRFDRWVVLPMTALLAGWLTAATWLNVASVYAMFDPSRLQLGAGPFALLVLLAATLFGWIVLVRAHGNLLYAGALVWALVGIVIANINDPNGVRLIAIAAGTIAGLTLVLALIISRRTGQPALG